MAHQLSTHVKSFLLLFSFESINLRYYSEGPPKLTSHPRQYLIHLLKPYSEREKAGLALRQKFWQEGTGYFAIQSTQPQTLGASLADSPVGLLAWIYEKLFKGTDGYPWTEDEGQNSLDFPYFLLTSVDSAAMGLHLLVLKSGTSSFGQNLL